MKQKLQNTEKVVVSGRILEYFDFSGVVDWGVESRELSLRRARKTLRRKINTNAGQWWDDINSRWFQPLFVTLTFKENVTDITEANKCFKLFIKKFNYNVFKSKKAVLKYVVVMEFQERGAVHYHAIFFNVPFFDLRMMFDLWDYGRTEVKSIDDIKNVGSYVVKYMVKEFDDVRLHGKKSYFSSRGLLKPLVIYDTGLLLDVLGFCNDDNKVTSVDLDDVHYEQFSDDVFRGFNSSKSINIGKGLSDDNSPLPDFQDSLFS